ncbi:MAG: hypothetical protein KGZ53_03085 [Peptococcaceae bacterium]|nr:hypothetical protein [Peptococcaceae bacterium]
MQTTKIYILLTNTGTFFTRLLGLCSRRPYNHSSIGFDIRLNEVYSFGRRKPRNPFIGGFVREHIRSGLYALCPGTSCTLYEFEVTAKQYELIRQNVCEFEVEKEKYSYSLIGVMGVALKTPVNRKYSYFCSQFIATVLERSGVYLFDKPSGLVTPEDFRQHPKARHIYEGMLAEYPAEAEVG